MNQRERVLRAIRFENPDRPPVWFFNRDHREGDILRCNLAPRQPDGATEWGYRWTSLGDGTMGQPEEPVLPDWRDLGKYEFPGLRKEERMARIGPFLADSEGYYRLAGCGISGFTTYTFLRGFENAVTDFCLEPERAGALLDGIFQFENQMISLAAECGFDGYHFEDDWGTQEALIIAPALWREVFKPRYRAQFEHAHRLGLQAWFHSCGNIAAIVEDFHEIGVDVLNLSQPNVVDLDSVGARLRGKQCFMAPVSYQTTSISGTAEQIAEEARRVFRLLGTPRGGFIGYIEEYGCVGMPEENYQACVQAFHGLAPGAL